MSRVIVFLLLATVALAQDDFLLKPKVKFDREYRALKAKHENREAAASQRYVTMLKAMIAYMEKNEDDFGVRPAKAELERFEKEGTVPAEVVLGTPELIKKAQDKYHEIYSSTDEANKRELDALVSKYLKGLTALQQQLLAKTRQAEADRVGVEIERVKALAGVSEPTNSDEAEEKLSLPKKYAGNLRMAFTFEERSGRKIRDLSGRRRHGEMVGADSVEDANEGLGYLFARGTDVMEIPEFHPGLSWTFIVRARFPLAKAKESRVLLSSGFRQHHISVDASGQLGVEDGAFVGCGHSINALKGWHELAAVAQAGKTLFLVDGKPVGVAGAACVKPVKALGNSAAGSRPWGGALTSAILWKGAWPARDVEALYLHRYAK